MNRMIQYLMQKSINVSLDQTNNSTTEYNQNKETRFEVIH